MSRLRVFLAAHGLDAVIVIIALAGTIGTLTRTGESQPDIPLQVGFEAAAVGVMILGLLLRRQAPFLVPAATWLISAGLSFLDGRLIVGQAPISIAGMIAAVLLGNVREGERQPPGCLSSSSVR